MNVRRIVCLLLVPLLTSSLAAAARAEDLFLAAGSEPAGKLWLSEEGAPLRPIHARAGRANPAFPRAIMRLAQVAVAADGRIYFCSGLDGSIMHLVDGRHEIQAFEFDGQVRDLACTGEEDTVYFSVVPTPQNGEPLADGRIYRRNFGDGQPTLVATIRQSDVGGNWWGTFAIHEGAIYIATLEDTSRVFRVDAPTVTLAIETRGVRIHGMTVGGDGTFYVVTGTGKVYRTMDFMTLTEVLTTRRRLTDAALRAPADGPRP